MNYRITLTGLDEYANLDSALRLLADYPELEFGFLYTETQLHQLALDLLKATGQSGLVRTRDMGKCGECGTATSSGMKKNCVRCAGKALRLWLFPERK